MQQLFRKKSVAYILAEAQERESAGHGLRKSLGVYDLTAFGIGAIIGAGIFSAIGTASFNGGPAVSLLFVFTALACAFSAICYAEFAASVPIAGSAYTYAYTSFGELVAWIIGWDLLIEYCIGNIVVAISWSDYFTRLLGDAGINFPVWLGMNYRTAHDGFLEAQQLAAGKQEVSAILQQASLAWQTAPEIAGLKFLIDLPALAVVILITGLIYIGIRESKTASNAMVILKLAIIALVIGLGAFFVKTENWIPFAPNGIPGIMKGVAAVFFAYIGFDAITTSAEECKNPNRDLPRAIFLSLIVCTVLYVLIALVLTGMVKYSQLNVGDPLAFVFSQIDLAPGIRNAISGIIAVSAVVAMSSVLLVMQMSQPRIWMSMSRDGLLPPVFARIHKRFLTPSFSTVLTGFVVGIPTLYFKLSEVTELTSIGTLFAFVLVCGGMLRLLMADDGHKAKYKITTFALPEIRIPLGDKLALPINIYTLGFIGLAVALFATQGGQSALQEMWDVNLLPEGERNMGMLIFHRFPLLLFVGLLFYIVGLSFYRILPLTPVLGLISCFFLMAQVPAPSWIRFLVWLAIGLAIYFGYGYRHSKLNKHAQAA